MKDFLDYSQYDLLVNKCELAWWERYRSEYQKAPKPGQKSDARTLGSLVHAGLDSYRKLGTPTIPISVCEMYDPTPECFIEAQALVNGYVMAYPQEQFTKYYCEEPLRFELHPKMQGLAKIDSYFNIGEMLQVEDGLGGQYALEPGWWIHEYKTKAASKDVGKYMGSWRMNMQANFQIMALHNLIGEMPKGVLVNVLEKAPEYTPIRTCKSCKERVELRDWRPTGDGYACPDCGNIQELDTSDKSKKPRVPKFYRIMVQRTLAELGRSRIDMYNVVERILDMEASFAMTGDPAAIRRTNSCIDQIWGECEFFAPHSQLLMASQYSGYVPIESLAYISK